MRGGVGRLLSGWAITLDYVLFPTLNGQGRFTFAMVCPLGAISSRPTKRVAVKGDSCTDREKRKTERCQCQC
jgi:hypothetical protein